MSNFNERVWKLTSEIPKGKVTTYREIAKKMNTKAYRRIGQTLKVNPTPIEVPCYRVVKSDGSIGGYSGNDPKMIKEKISLLRKDGIEIKNGKIELRKYLHCFV